MDPQDRGLDVAMDEDVGADYTRWNTMAADAGPVHGADAVRHVGGNALTLLVVGSTNAPGVETFE